MKINKCEPGYISYNKKINAIWVLAFALIGIAIFLTGYFVTHTRANIFTVMAVLMVLPAARKMVGLFVMLPRKSVTKERFEKVKDWCGEGTLLTDYVFTSSEKIMHLDFLLIKNGNVLAVTAPFKQDIPYMKKYLAASVHKAAPDYFVKVFENEEQMRKQLAKLSVIPSVPEREKKLLALLRSLAV